MIDVFADLPSQASEHGSALGWGLGLKEVVGRPTSTLAWRAYVKRKATLTEIPRADRIPPVIDGLPTDVIERADHWLTRRRHDSLSPGTRLVNRFGVPGALGGFAWRKGDGERVVIGSWHVLFGEGAAVGDPIFIVAADASPAAFQPLGRIRGGALGITNYEGVDFHVDVGMASCDAKKAFLTAWRCGEVAPREAAWAKPGGFVRKQGAASGATSGVVVDVAYPDVAVIEGRAMPAVRQILVRMNESDASSRFAECGDSGALLTDCEDRAVGILWGCNARGEGIACHLAPALAALDVSLTPPRVRWRERLSRLARGLFREGI